MHFVCLRFKCCCSTYKFFVLAILESYLVRVCHGEMICYRQLIKFGLGRLLVVPAGADFNGIVLVDVGTLCLFRS